MTSLLGLSLLIFPLNYEGRYQRAQDQTIQAIHPTNLSLGGEYGRWRGLLEYGYSTNSDGNQSYNIKTQHQEYLIEGGYDFVQAHLPADRNFQLRVFGGGGLGTYQETVDTTLLGNTSRDSGGQKLTEDLFIGAGIRYKYFALELEGRSLFGDNYDPQPNMDFVARVGIRIQLTTNEKPKSRPTEIKKPGVLDPRVQKNEIQKQNSDQEEYK